MGKRHIIAVRVGHPGSVGRAPDAQRGSRRTIALIMTEEGDGAWFADQTVVSGNACAGLVDRSGRILLSERLSGPVAGRPGAPADAGGARRPFLWKWNHCKPFRQNPDDNTFRMPGFQNTRH